MFALPRRSRPLLAFGMVLVIIVGAGFSARSIAGATNSPLAPPARTSSTAAPNAPTLHNPSYDNRIWYEFHLRYDPSYPLGTWLPAGNTYDDSQDWRLWFLNGTDLINADPSRAAVQSEPDSVQFRTFNAKGRQVAGVYQVVPGATPCRTYQFQIYGLSRQKEPDDFLSGMKAGIEPTGWDLDPNHAPAVHSWPATMVWGDSHSYTSSYGPLTVSAEALNNQITVFSYADASGGNSHKIHWDSTSLLDVTPAQIADPNALPTPGGINNLTESPSSTSATVSWTTSGVSIGQVYYRPESSSEGEPIPDTYTYTLHLPMVIGGSSTDWRATPLGETASTSHNVILTNLSPGKSYEYAVVSRGVSGSQCITWASEKRTFTTNP
jgi:hypothetical protein